MNASIVEKVRATLADDIDSECKVVYVLAECRKLFPEYKSRQFALSMYCHWALHVNLDVPRTTRDFLEQVDAFVGSVLQGNVDIFAENRALNHFVLLDTFRQELREFLKAFSLPTALCDEDARWHEFLKHYSGVIEDGSVACRGDNLKFVDRVVFSKGQPRPSGMHMPFDLTWNIFLRDNRRITVETNTSPLPDGQRMRGWTVRLGS